MIQTFLIIILTYETTFYQDILTETKWLKDKDNFIDSKKKEKLDQWVPLIHTSKLLSTYLKRISKLRFILMFIRSSKNDGNKESKKL